MPIAYMPDRRRQIPQVDFSFIPLAAAETNRVGALKALASEFGLPIPDSIGNDSAALGQYINTAGPYFMKAKEQAAQQGKLDEFTQTQARLKEAGKAHKDLQIENQGDDFYRATINKGLGVFDLPNLSTNADVKSARKEALGIMKALETNPEGAKVAIQHFMTKYADQQAVAGLMAQVQAQGQEALKAQGEDTVSKLAAQNADPEAIRTVAAHIPGSIAAEVLASGGIKKSDAPQTPQSLQKLLDVTGQTVPGATGAVARNRAAQEATKTATEAPTDKVRLALRAAGGDRTAIKALHMLAPMDRQLTIVELAFRSQDPNTPPQERDTAEKALKVLRDLHLSPIQSVIDQTLGGGDQGALVPTGGAPAAPQAQGFSDLPDPAQFKGRTITETGTKKKFTSNGKAWVPAQ